MAETSSSTRPRDAASTTLTPEMQLLLLVARQQLSEANRAHLTTIVAEQRIDWDAAIHAARWHKISGYLYKHLNDTGLGEQMPAAALDALKGDYLRSTARFLYYKNELGTILSTLRDADIPVIVLKGSAMVGRVYANGGVRPMADIDVLIPEDTVEEAHGLVKTLGYRPGEDDQADPEHWALHQHLPILLGIQKAIAVEVHRHIVRKDSALAFDLKGFWERARDEEIAGVTAKILSPEDFLLHLAINFFRDRRFYSFGALSQISDMSELLLYQERSAEFDWDAFVAHATEYQVIGPVACSLSVAKALIGAPVPDNVLERLWQGHIPEESLTAFTAERVLTTTEWDATELVPSNAEYGLGTLATSARMRLLPARATMRHKYGSASPMAYVRHIGARIPKLARMLSKPWAINEELKVDRWLHSLYTRTPTTADLAED